jgi:acyl carrier protein phosphodiesterase
MGSGKQFKNYPVMFKGIILHRAIDTFTDAHPVFRRLKTAFKIPSLCWCYR